MSSYGEELETRPAARSGTAPVPHPTIRANKPARHLTLIFGDETARVEHVMETGSKSSRDREGPACRDAIRIFLRLAL
jgi:hypothetical protein